MMMTLPVTKTSTRSTTKAAEIHRESNGTVHYVCFHCGFDSDSIDDTLIHIEIHFPLPDMIQSDEHFDFVDVKCEPDDSQTVNASQPEQIFIDCGAKSSLKNETDAQASLSDSNELQGLFEWKCLHCYRIFNKVTTLRHHLNKHENKDPVLHSLDGSTHKVKAHFMLKCTLCSSEFYDETSSEKHLKEFHTASPPVKCFVCKARFQSAEMFQQHKDLHCFDDAVGENLNGLCNYECLYCGEVTTELDGMDKHLTSHNGEELPKTDENDSDTSSPLNEIRHKIKFKYVCIHCPLKFRISTVAKRHVTIEHKNETVESKQQIQSNEVIESQKIFEERLKNTHCNTCDLTFRSWRSLTCHRAKLHPETLPKKHRKEPCLKRKYTKRVDRLSETNESGNKKKERSTDDNHCSICNITFLTNRSMTNHRTKRHPETVQVRAQTVLESFTCKDCGKVFRDRSNFKHHRETHEKRHVYTCDLCNKSYRLRHSLKTHMLTHINEKNFVCEECGKSFYTTSKLNFHKQVHENLILHCDKCDKVFYTRNNFSKHSKTHIDQKRLACTMCDNTFKSKTSLRVHMLLHDGEKKYACRYCDMKFSQSSGRRGHERSRHGFV